MPKRPFPASVESRVEMHPLSALKRRDLTEFGVIWQVVTTDEKQVMARTTTGHLLAARHDVAGKVMVAVLGEVTELELAALVEAVEARERWVHEQVDRYLPVPVLPGS